MRPVRLPPFVFVAALLAAVLALPSSPPAMAGPMGPPPQQPTPEQIARGYLAKAREYGAGSEKLESKCDPHAIDGFYAAAEAAWNAVWTCPGSREILCEAALVYADALEGLLATADAHGRIDGRGLWVGSRWKPTCVPIQTRGLPVDATAIERVVATPPPGDSRITRRHVRGGFGLPVALRVKPATHGTAAREFMPPRQSLAATAVLPARPLLAADLTAPLLDMLEGMPRAGISGFLQPFGPGDTQPRLEFLQPHRPGRIPVVFIHGLASDEGTWFDMINELQSWPTFHRRYEPWVYHYPTGASFLVSSATLRRQLTAAVEQLDPSGSDQALRSMVLVGHSMGGLHAKLQVVDPGTALWDALACKPFDEIVMRPEIRRKVAPNYFFRPRPFVKRIVFIATPHSGSMLASLGVGRAASLTVRQPPESKAIHDEVVAANPDGFRQWYARRLPTTIDALEPSSPLIKSLRELRVPCWVTTHSVIGVAPQSLATCPGDCVVSAESARLPGVASEITVPAGHTRVHHHPETIREVERILSEHLRETGL
jgi:pimeloyl-ACP methyl ester carboxylesterase